MRIGRIGLLLLLAASIAAFFLLGGAEQLTLSGLKARQAELGGFVEARPAVAVAGFFLLYVAVTALSLPGAAIMTLAAGAIFGLVLGTVVVSFASTLGASLAFLSSRYLLRDWVRGRFGKRIGSIDEGLARDGPFYLLTLRLIPVVPFFLVNLAMGLTAMRVLTFALVSQLGMLPGTLLYVNAGTELAAIESTADILSPTLIGSLVLLGLFPLFAKALVGWLRGRRVYRGWKKPRRFDRNLIVIGAGAGGLVTAYIGATVKAKVTLIEGHKMGGDCLNTGCVPSKALIRAARAAHEVRTADRFGVRSAEPQIDFPALMQRIFDVIRHIEPADSVERFEGVGVDVRLGHARLIDPWTVEVNSERLTAPAIVLATGAEPNMPPILGLAEAGALNSDTMWDRFHARGQLPERLAIIGAGPIGIEMSQSFARLGSQVTLVEGGPRIMPGEDADVAAFVQERLRQEGVQVLTGNKALACEGKVLVVEGPEGTARVPFDEIIVAVGRKPRLTGFGLEELGIDTSQPLEVNGQLQTRFPHIYAVGDLVGPYRFTHAASHQAWHAAVNALFGSFRRFKVDYSVMPWVTYTDPEVAHVGHNEDSAKAAGIPYELVRYELGHLDRAVAEGANHGFVKMLVVPGKSKILGATIVAHSAGELIAEVALAMKQGIGMGKLLSTVKAYPTMAEATRFAASEWRQAHKPERILKLLERYHRWRRG